MMDAHDSESLKHVARKLTEEHIMQLQHSMSALAQLILPLPLSEYLTMVNRAETLGPIFDPTLYMKGAKSMREWSDLAQILYTAQKAINKLELFKHMARSRLTEATVREMKKEEAMIKEIDNEEYRGED